MDLSCPDESHPFSQPLLSSADAGWELPFHQISCSSSRTWVSLWALKANGPASRAAWIFTVLKCPDILLLLQRQKRSYFWGFFWKQKGKPSSFLFVCSCAICGCFYGESTARMELNCQTWDRLPMSIIEVLQAAGVTGLHVPLWNGGCVTGSPWVFMSQRLLRRMARLCCCTLNCSPDLLWVLAFLSSSGLFPAVLVYWPKIFPSL